MTCKSGLGGRRKSAASGNESDAPRVLDPRTGEPIDHLKMGDSFVPYMELARAHSEKS